MDGMEGKETTHFALSIRNGVLLNVCKRTGEEGFTYYVSHNLRIQLSKENTAMRWE